MNKSNEKTHYTCFNFCIAAESFFFHLKNWSNFPFDLFKSCWIYFSYYLMFMPECDYGWKSLFVVMTFFCKVLTSTFKSLISFYKSYLRSDNRTLIISLLAFTPYWFEHFLLDSNKYSIFLPFQNLLMKRNLVLWKLYNLSRQHRIKKMLSFYYKSNQSADEMYLLKTC